MLSSWLSPTSPRLCPPVLLGLDDKRYQVLVLVALMLNDVWP